MGRGGRREEAMIETATLQTMYFYVICIDKIMNNRQSISGVS